MANEVEPGYVCSTEVQEFSSHLGRTACVQITDISSGPLEIKNVEI